MRIIFLDVDGVLNNNYTTDKIYGWTGIDPELTKILKWIYDESNKEEETKIVVSSSWRYDEIRSKREGYTRVDNCYTVLLERLANNGIEVLDYTPRLDSSWKRGKEILWWIEEYEKDHDKISNYVVLDDEEFDFTDHEDLYKRFVRTLEEFPPNEDDKSYYYTYGTGLTQELAERALDILRGNIGDK